MILKTLMSGVTTDTTGDWIEFGEGQKAFQIDVSGTATVKLQAAQDPSLTPVDLMTTTTSGGYENSAPWKYIRVVTSGMTGATVSVIAAHE